jgi:hypothetical protein
MARILMIWTTSIRWLGWAFSKGCGCVRRVVKAVSIGNWKAFISTCQNKDTTTHLTQISSYHLDPCQLGVSPGGKKGLLESNDFFLDNRQHLRRPNEFDKIQYTPTLYTSTITHKNSQYSQNIVNIPDDWLVGTCETCESHPASQSPNLDGTREDWLFAARARHDAKWSYKVGRGQHGLLQPMYLQSHQALCPVLTSAGLAQEHAPC